MFIAPSKHFSNASHSPSSRRVWLCFASLGADVEGEVRRALTGCCGHASSPDWLLELLFRLRAVQMGRVDCDSAKPAQVTHWTVGIV